ncbi:E3 ubiquitin-protein ligase RNF12-B-like [Cydia strobilella]|uniref:E3 ubiquitin-protein ligase RNF12-B-like n=1 Tax=Cydia strobilella TaxID=1100964 RepID=UPI003005BA67
MKLLLTVVALAAVTHGAPTSSQTMEISANGVSGSVLNIPLVEIIVNMISNEAVAPGTVNEPVIEAEPVLVVDDVQLPTPVIVVDHPEINPIDVIAVNPMPAPAPAPAPAAPAPAEVVPSPTPVDVVPMPAEIVEVPAPEAEAAEGSSQIINVMLNFIFGASGSLSSVEVPTNIIPQVVGAPRV